VPLTPRPNRHNLAYLQTKRDRMGHQLPDLSPEPTPQPMPQPTAEPTPESAPEPTPGVRL
jgi:3,4-dihydroxy 2-butanone 4-phosphate synthase / GTP cyclohydrolase II